MKDCIILQGDAVTRLRELASDSVDCSITSPPYFGLRDYKAEGQIGMEPSVDAYSARLLEVFTEVRRVLKPTGSLWLNLGDTYAANRGYQVSDTKHPSHSFGRSNRTGVPLGMKAKDLMGVPWMVAFALRSAGWFLRSEIIWEKPNVMPESVRDRPTRSHETLFLLTKEPHYYYDLDAVREPHQGKPQRRLTHRSNHPKGDAGRSPHMRANYREELADHAGHNGHPLGRNRRTVWSIPTKAYRGAHFAVFPAELVRPCVLAGCPAGGTVLDPFAGSGTTGVVALEHGRRALLIELNPDYIALIERRLDMVQPRLM